MSVDFPSNTGNHLSAQIVDGDQAKMNSTINRCLLTLLSLVVTSQAYCDTEDAPHPWILSADKGHVFFAMFPPSGDSQKNDGGRGICYRLEPDGSLKELWRVSGWYTFAGHLSRSGEFLVRLGPWAKDLENHSDLAVAFYRNGKLVKKHRVNELVKNVDALEYSVSHYSWQPARQSEPDQFIDDTFMLTLIDATIYEFDLNTGEIIHTAIDPYAAGQRVVDEEIAKIHLESEKTQNN
jgi:hypothetical protein